MFRPSLLSLLLCVHVFTIKILFVQFDCVHVALCALAVKIPSHLIHPKSFTIQLHDSTPSGQLLWNVRVYVWCVYIKAALDL